MPRFGSSAHGSSRSCAGCFSSMAVAPGGPGRCTVHKHRNLLAHAPQRLHDEVSADYNDMIYATSATEIEVRRRAFIRKWRLKCKAVADSLEEAGDRLFTYTRLPVSQWKSARTANTIERLPQEFNAGSRPKRCCPRPRPQRCCSGRC